MENPKKTLQICDSKTSQEVPAEPTSPMYNQERPAKKETEIAKQASIGFLEALCLVENLLDPSPTEERTLIAKRIEKTLEGRIRSTAIYSKVMWFTS